MLKYPRTGKRGAPQAFARKLFEILSSEDPNVISWTSAGDAFVIKDLDEFVSSVLLKYFRHQKFSSFQRQLNLYGFRKVHKGADAGAYGHPNFRRDQPERLDQIRRTPQSSARNKHQHARHSLTSDDEDEDHEHDDEPSVESSPSCISSLSKCMISTCESSGHLPPPPSYESVIQADAADIPTQLSVKRELSDEEQYEYTIRQHPPVDSAASCCFSLGQPNDDRNVTLFNDKVYEYLGGRSALQRKFAKMGSGDWEGTAISFDTSTCYAQQAFPAESEALEMDVENFATIDAVDFSVPAEDSFFDMESFTAAHTTSNFSSDLSKPSLSRWCSTQSQEWEIDQTAIETDFDFDQILAQLDPKIPEATPISGPPMFPVAQAHMVSSAPQSRTPARTSRATSTATSTAFASMTSERRMRTRAQTNALPPVPTVNMSAFHMC